MTKAFRYHQHGGPEVLRFEDVEVGKPGPGQVRIRNKAVAVNYRDVLLRKGIHAVKSFPARIGLESAGVIDAIGAGVDGFAVGDRVAYAGMPEGSYAEERIVPTTRLLALPAGIDERLAASMMIRGMTARSLLYDTYPVKPGETILIHAAAGGVGLIMCQWAKHLGATVIGTVGSDEKAAVARAHGCDHPIVYTREDFPARVREITGGEGVPVVYDSVGKATFEGSLLCLRRRGVMASFGEASGDPDPMPPRRLGALGSIYLTHPSVSNYTATRQELLATANHLFDMVGSGRIKIEISKTYPLRDAPSAHADIEVAQDHRIDRAGGVSHPRRSVTRHPEVPAHHKLAIATGTELRGPRRRTGHQRGRSSFEARDAGKPAQPAQACLRWRAPQRLCSLSSVLPLFLVSEHGVENSEDFAGDGNERNHFGLTASEQSLVEDTHHRIAANGGESRHEDGRAYRWSTAGDHALFPSIGRTDA